MGGQTTVQSGGGFPGKPAQGDKRSRRWAGLFVALYGTRVRAANASARVANLGLAPGVRVLNYGTPGQASPGQGRSKGYRTVILFRRGAKAFFVYGFAKSQRANIDDDEEEQFKEAAKHVL